MREIKKRPHFAILYTANNGTDIFINVQLRVTDNNQKWKLFLCFVDSYSKET